MSSVLFNLVDRLSNRYNKFKKIFTKMTCDKQFYQPHFLVTLFLKQWNKLLLGIGYIVSEITLLAFYAFLQGIPEKPRGYDCILFLYYFMF